MESFLDNLNRNTQPSRPWHVRVPARIMNAAFAIVYLPVLVLVILPLLIVVGVPTWIMGLVYDSVWNRPSKVRRLRKVGRVVEAAECLARWRAGEGTLLLDCTPKGYGGVWWTPDAVEPPERDLTAWKPTNDREEAEKWAEAAVLVAKLRKRYIDLELGSALYVRGLDTSKAIKPVIEAPGAGRVLELWFLSDENAQWWWYAAGGQCRECGYDLAGLPRGSRCPECGTEAAGDRSSGR